MTGCDDFLGIENLNAPDRAAATANALDLQAFIAGAFYPDMWDALHNDAQAERAFPLAGIEFTATMAEQGTLLQFNDHVAEPRGVHDNGVVVSLGNGPQGPRDMWATVHSVNSVVHDGLNILAESGLTIEEDGEDVTPRARAFAKLIQGWSWGYLGLLFDEAHVIDEDTPIPANADALYELTLSSLVPYDQVIAAAVSALEEAITIAEANPSVVDFPSASTSALWFGTADPVSNAQFIELANTLAARFLVLAARDPTERAAVDWNRVLSFTDRGLTSDLEFQLSNQRTSRLFNHFTNNSAGTENFRWDYRSIGPSDQSGAYQTWIGGAISSRDRFLITTPDRRITGPTPDSDGSYTAYRADDNGFEPARGLYAYSAYQWRRHALANGLANDNSDTGNNLGTAPLVTVTENDLLAAEAYARLTMNIEAADRINITRTATQTIDGTSYPGLPAVTDAGVPDVGGECVPRLDSGACGNLLAAVRYERMIELAATDMIRGWADTRGWGMLPSGTPFHYPVPGNVLDLYDLPNYTYGGVGRDGSATYAPAP